MRIIVKLLNPWYDQDSLLGSSFLLATAGTMRDNWVWQLSPLQGLVHNICSYFSLTMVVEKYASFLKIGEYLSSKVAKYFFSLSVQRDIFRGTCFVAVASWLTQLGCHKCISKSEMQSGNRDLWSEKFKQGWPLKKWLMFFALCLYEWWHKKSNN